MLRRWGTETAPDTFTAQAWIKTTTTSGGRIFGFGDLQTGNSGHRDRHIYMNNSGRLIFGVKAQDNSLRTVTSGRRLQRQPVAPGHGDHGSAGHGAVRRWSPRRRRADTTQGEAYVGYWRLGGDNLGGWPGAPGNANFVTETSTRSRCTRPR